MPRLPTAIDIEEDTRGRVGVGTGDGDALRQSVWSVGCDLDLNAAWEELRAAPRVLAEEGVGFVEGDDLSCDRFRNVRKIYCESGYIDVYEAYLVECSRRRERWG